jgi:hypothetical protein
MCNRTVALLPIGEASDSANSEQCTCAEGLLYVPPFSIHGGTLEL